ncbi:DUF5004 domain-containing protein [Galbibacter sp. EGI 63066]|uniref:DUF5004 domain-containing protein n=1 Tax=Galbibacter sp. EGI 63066 TaxID=2993559 RepID=UPI002248F2D3|nr:DUF5004 domain-containing protein [Galbibacter sp. EGI 63066]MCX2678967.1 DUF5004 domain-containing protein [Galbibacter sp. EGI 63066]
MKQIIIAAFLMVFTGTFISCSDDDGVDCTPEYTGELTTGETSLVGTWTLTALVLDEEVDLTDDGEDNPSTDWYAQRTDCENDEVYTFSSDRSFSIEQGVSVEGCSNPAEFTGTWKLSSGALASNYASACLEEFSALDFNAEQTSFNITKTGIIRDVNGEDVQVEVVFTYTKDTAEQAPE